MILLILFLNYLYFYYSHTALGIGIIFFTIFYFFITYIVSFGNKIIPEKSDNFKREVFFTVSNFCIYFLMVHIFFIFFEKGYLAFDFSMSIMVPILGILFILGHDVYFYVLHRILHQRWMLKNIHYVHHQSHISSIWTSYSFHPIEGILYTWVVLGIFFISMNFYALLFAIFYNDLLTILGHSGKENFSPKYLKEHKIFRFFATPTYHDLHHSRSLGNFALYFLYLDKLFGTYDTKHKDYI